MGLVSFFLLIILNMAPFFLFFNAARLFWLFCFFLSDRSRFRKCFIFFCESDQVTFGRCDIVSVTGGFRYRSLSRRRNKTRSGAPSFASRPATAAAAAASRENRWNKKKKAKTLVTRNRFNRGRNSVQVHGAKT